MAVEKVTLMVLKVDLQCSSCYKKTKRTLCKFPQIRDQIYNEKANTVTVTVVCCSPEKIRDKLCYKGGKAIKSIQILEPDNKPKQAEKPKEPADKPKQAEKPKEPADKPKQADNPKQAEKLKEPEKKVTILEPKDAGKLKDGGGEKLKSNMKPSSDGGPPPPQAEKPKDGPKPEPSKNTGMMMNPIPVQQAVPAQGVPSVFPYVGPSYDGYGAGPYYHGYGYPLPPPQPMYEGYYGHGQDQYGYGYGYGGRVAHVNRSDSYFTEEEPGCSIM